ncbi:Gfo/Idh/MocA family oxidoreductase [Daejeonella oryzae]|uniref:Gfo/Idh/MocA family oxidoreductase n=1 Tax=Daejeonella oryzae TaxID=1122943 RepID=UPI00042531AE|nr:Gfo/Idh/MocA family oxidoreductase [Daejeonella oryzae]
MQKEITTGLMAYGMSGKVFHAPFLDQHPGFKFSGVLERNKKSAQKDYPYIRSFDHSEDLLTNSDIELIVVNTPNNTHFEFAKQALLAGKHVLIEKPAATSIIEVKELFDLGRSVGKKVMIYQNRRWSSDFLATKEVLESGKLGQIIEIHLRFDRFRNFIGPKAFKENPVPGSGILYDLGAHLLDQAISLYGKPLSARKTLGKYRPGSQVDDYAHLHLKYPNQLNVFITLSMLVADPQPGIMIHGTKGSFIKSFCDTQEDQLISGMKPGDAGFGEELPGKEGHLTIVNENGEKEHVLVPSTRGRYMDLFEDVFQCIRNDKDFPVKEEDILAQLEILEQKAD